MPTKGPSIILTNARCCGILALHNGMIRQLDAGKSCGDLSQPSLRDYGILLASFVVEAFVPKAPSEDSQLYAVIRKPGEEFLCSVVLFGKGCFDCERGRYALSFSAQHDRKPEHG